MNRFDYIKYDKQSMGNQEAFKSMFKDLELHVVKSLPFGRAQSLALTKLEEAYMWVGKAIRDDQLRREGTVDLQEERKNG